MTLGRAESCVLPAALGEFTIGTELHRSEALAAATIVLSVAAAGAGFALTR